MNKELKNRLKQGFEAPDPVKKEDFLRSMQTPSISCFKFVCLQAAYIRKWIWMLSVVIFLIALVGAAYMEKNMLWCISAFMPILAWTVIAESGRSESCSMAELELATRFSLKSVVLARLGILGIADLILTGLLLPLAFRNSKATIVQTGIYMLCPYLLTVFLGLWAVRRVRGREAVYLCAGIAAGVSALSVFLYPSLPSIYERQELAWWIGAFLLLGAGAAKQCSQVIKRTEELTWNL